MWLMSSHVHAVDRALNIIHTRNARPRGMRMRQWHTTFADYQTGPPASNVLLRPSHNHFQQSFVFIKISRLRSHSRPLKQDLCLRLHRPRSILSEDYQECVYSDQLKDVQLTESSAASNFPRLPLLHGLRRHSLLMVHYLLRVEGRLQG